VHACSLHRRGGATRSSSGFSASCVTGCGGYNIDSNRTRPATTCAALGRLPRERSPFSTRSSSIAADPVHTGCSASVIPDLGTVPWPQRRIVIFTQCRRAGLTARLPIVRSIFDVPRPRRPALCPRRARCVDRVSPSATTPPTILRSPRTLVELMGSRLPCGRRGDRSGLPAGRSVIIARRGSTS